MRKIYKYNLANTIDNVQSILMSKDAHILDFRLQYEFFPIDFDPSPIPVIWATVPSEAKSDATEIRSFVLRFTGSLTNEITHHYIGDIVLKDGDETYIGTDIARDGLVYHLFEIRK